MGILFIENTSSDPTTLLMQLRDGKAINYGPEGAVSVLHNDKQVNICLSADVENERTAVNDKVVVDVETTLVAISINGVLEPYAFPKETLTTHYAKTADRRIFVTKETENGPLTFTNSDVLDEIELRVYNLVGTGKLVVTDEIESGVVPIGLSTATGFSVKLKPNYDVDCTGAVPFAGLLDLTLDDGEFYVTYAPGIKAKAASVDEFIQILTGDAIGLEVSTITPWAHQKT